MTTCFIPNCDKEISSWPPACQKHWNALPDPFKDAIRAGAPRPHERPSDQYREAIDRAAEYMRAAAEEPSPAERAAAQHARIIGERD